MSNTHCCEACMFIYSFQNHIGNLNSELPGIQIDVIFHSDGEEECTKLP